MSRKTNQKAKLLMLARIFENDTDENHPLTLKQLIEKLESNGTPVDRKTLYTDIEELRLAGYDIIIDNKGRYSNYYLGERNFELAEIKLLVDSVQSAKFITEKKSNRLIKKLESLVSVHQAKHLKRQVIISGRIKTMNESIYYNVDKLHEAIIAKRQISFQYFQWNRYKKMEMRRGGGLYTVSPFCLMWDNEKYYLVAYEAQSDTLKHFRVDKMKSIALLNEHILGEEAFAEFNVAEYSNSLFGMFGGPQEHVTLQCHNDLAGVIIDRFGKKVTLSPVGEDAFKVVVDVAVSDQFLAWVISLGEGVRITAPLRVVEEIRAKSERLYKQYHNDTL